MKSEVAFRQGNARGVAPSLEKRVDQENSDRLALIRCTQRTSGVGGAEALCAVPCFAASGAAVRGAALCSGHEICPPEDVRKVVCLHAPDTII